MPDTTFLNPESGSPRKTAADWVREMRMSADVNKTTVGVDTDRVTPDLLLATSNKLLKINKREAEPDSKDSLQFQRIYSAPDFVAEHVLRDAGRVGRQLLWKATNRGNVDFMPTGALDQHVSDVFNTSKMANMIDGSSPLEVTEATYKVTRIGEGGLSTQDSAPVEMRLVQPSFLGYIDPVSTPECYASDTELMTERGWKTITAITAEDKLACLVDGRLEFHTPREMHVYDYDGLLYGYEDHKGVSYLVTGNHRMYTRCTSLLRNDKPCAYNIRQADDIQGKERTVRTGGVEPVIYDERITRFELPSVAPELKHPQVPGMPPQGASTKNIDDVDILDFAEFLGWYLSEGCFFIDHKKGYYRIDISQNAKKNPENFKAIQEIVRRLPFNNKATGKNGKTISISRKQLTVYLAQFGHSADKHIPDWVFTAPLEARRRFRDALLKGDGREGRHLCTMSRQLALDFERLQFGLGESVFVYHEAEKRLDNHPGIWIVYWHKRQERGLRPAKKQHGSSRGYYTQQYRGKVYCPTVPGGLVYCRRPGHVGFWCGNSFRVGLDGVFTKHCMKGTDGKLYQKFINARTGKEELVDSVTASKSVVTTPDMMSANTDHIFALGGKTGARIVNKSDVDYYLPRMDDAFSNAVNAVTGISGVKELRLRMGCLHPMTTMLTVDKENRVHIMHAKSVNKSSGRLPVISNVGGTTYQPIRGTYSKFPQNRAWFRKVVLYSGRVLVTSRDHRWSVLGKDGSIDLVNAEKLKAGDKVMRTMFKDIPGRRTFINGVLINKPVAVLLGYAVRTLSNPDDDKLTITYQRRHEKTVAEAIKRIGAEDEVKFYVTARKLTLSTSKGWFHDWLAKNIGADELRCVPSEILSANLDIVAVFLDAYTADETQIAEDSGEDLWILNLPNTTARDGIAYLLARTGTDTYYRDAYLGNGKTELALKLSTPGRLQGDCVVDEIKSVLPAPNAAIMVDIDVDDQLYATANGIVTHNSKYPQQAVSLIDREAPLVRGLDEQSGKDMSTLFGKYLGARYAPKAGTVSAVRKDRIDMVYDDGTRGSVALYNNYPMNSKGFIDNTPTVKAGMHVDKNGLLASSNYTNDKGEAALGTNLRVGWISWRGGTYEDAIVISESTAKKLTSNTMYAKALDLDKTVTLGKPNYLAWKPGEYTKEQLSALDNEGIIKPGSVIHKGDPLVLAVRTSEPSPGTMGKRVLTDISETWEHDHPGTVTDVVRTKNGVKVLAVVTAPAEVGDKLSNNYGAKGVISKVLPDDEMPKDKDGKPLEVLMAPLGLVSRCYDEETEFLTKDGWKFGKDMLDSDLLYCYNRDTDTWMWGEQLSAFWRAPFDGYMFSFSNDTADFCVTPGHRVWAAPDCPGSSYMECHIEDIYGKTCYIPAVARRRHKAVESTQFELPVTDEEHMTFPAGDWTEFLGWYTLQGTTTYDTATDEYFVQLKHPDTDPATIHRKASLLSRLHLTYSYEKDSLSFFIHDKKLAEYTKGLGEGRNKKLPAWLMQQPDDILYTFLNIMQEGTTPGNTRDILLLSENIADQLQQMLCMLGLVSVKSTTDAGSYKLSIDTTGKCEHLLKDKWEKTAYKGMTYCPTVATGYILTRRHGKCACMGNTNPMQLDETLLGKVAHKTGKPEVIPAFYNGDRHQYVLDRLKQNRLNADDDFFDPETGRKIPNVVNGYSYIYKLKHMSESKESGRGTDEYNADDTPGGHGYAGSKRFGNLEVAALVGHCLLGYVRVLTRDGYMPISQIVSGRLPVEVVSYNKNTDRFEFKRVTNWFARSVAQSDLWRLTTNARQDTPNKSVLRGYHHSLRCTKEHKILTPDRGFVPACELKPGDLVYNRGPLVLDWQQTIIKGTLMGDGYMSKHTNKLGMTCANLRVVHGPKQHTYTNWMYDKLRNLCMSPPTTTQHRIGRKQGRTFNTGAQKRLATVSTYELNQIADSFYKDINGKRVKTVPVGIIKQLGYAGIAVWFMDDGGVETCKNRSAHAMTFHTCGFTVDECYRLCAELNEFTGLHFTVLKKAGKYPIVRLNKGSTDKDKGQTERFAAQLAPYILEEFRYKLGANYPKELPVGNYWKDKVAPPFTLHGEPCAVVESAPLKEKPEDGYVVYDITVPDNHNFIASGIVVSNSAFDTLLDAKLIRGQANSDFWRSLRTGEIPTIPGEPLVQRKFFSHLQGAGVNVRKTPKGISVFALSNSDVSSLAGPREVKSRDTYEAKNFRPIDGGLFGQDIFGINGDKWGYIKLDEPLPNPVMAAPLAKLLRMSDKDFVAIASGQKEIDGMSNSTQLKDRLEHIDLAKESKTALKEFKEAPASKKDATLKRYVAVERMRRAGLNPSEYMLDKIPVLPPIFRPVSSHGGLTMVADANYLYAQLLDARDDLRESRDLPQEYQDKARANIYNKWQELTGLYDPEDVKLKNKNVGGLLQWALGKGSPKFSAAQRKVVGMSVDTVGRGAIVPDSRLTIDEVGIPVSMAFSVMAPFVERKLVQRGYTPVAAMKMVKNQDKQALDVLQEVVDTHPVEMNRAPSLHKFNIMAFKPRLVRGHAVHVNPSVCPGFNADFDGDSMLNLTRIAVDTQAIKNKVEKTGKNNLTSLESGVYSVWCQNGGTDNTGEHKMISNNTKCAFATVTAPLSSLPVVEGSAVTKSDTVTEWDVQGGFYTDTVDPATGKHELAQITKVSKHTGLRMFDCTLSMRGSYKHIATVSEDHSLITIDPKTLELTKTRPEDAEGRLVPVVRGSKGNDWDKCAKYITMGIELPSSYALGLFIGIMLGDGWVNCQNLAFIACCDKSLQRFILDLVNGGDTHIPQRKPAALQVYGPLEDRFSDKDRARIALYIDWKVSKALHDLIGDGAYNKRIPDDCMMASRAHLIGILMGLLATDGSVSYAAGTKAKKKAAKTITINTTSCLLKDGIQELCRRLGIRTGATPYRGIHSKVDCYAVTLSIVDVAAAAKKNPTLFRIPMQSKQEALEKIILEVENSPVPQETDIVPFPSSMRGEFVTVGANTKFLTYYNNAITKGYIGRKVALKIAKDMEDHDWTSFTEPRSVYAKHRSNRTPEEAEAVVNKWISTVRDTDIAWEHVDSVVPSSCTEGWDCTVPGPYTFVLSTGTVVQDTVNIHVPVSDNARKEALEKMLPSRNLTTLSNHKIMNKPEKEYLQGLYIATRLGKQSPGGTRKFNSLEEARDAYRRGEIDVDTPIDLV